VVFFFGERRHSGYEYYAPILPNSSLGAELFLFGPADVVVMLHLLLAGPANAGHHRTALATEQFAKQNVIYLRLFVCACFLIECQQILNLIEDIYIHNRRHGVLDSYFPVVFISTDVLLVF